MLILILAWKYFQQNKEKTYRATLILMLNLSVIVASDLLTSGFVNQIEQFSDLSTNQNTRYLTIYSNNLANPEIFSTNLLSEISTILDQSQYVEDYIPFMVTNAEIRLENNFVASSSTIIVNTTKWFDYYPVYLLTPGSNSTLYSSQLINIDINMEYTLLIESYTLPFSNFAVFSDNSFNSPEILIDYKHVSLPVKLMLSNVIRVEFSLLGDGSEIIDELSNFTGLIFEFPNQREIFLVTSANQLISILIILQIAMFFILIPSIAYVILNLFLEIKNDIKILRQLGLSNLKVVSLLAGIIFIISSLASLFAIYFSIVLINILAAFIALMTPLPFIVTSTKPIVILFVLLQSFVTGFIVSIIPTYQVLR